MKSARKLVIFYVLGREPSLKIMTIRGYLCRVTCIDHRIPLRGVFNKVSSLISAIQC